MAEWFKATDSSSVIARCVGSNPTLFKQVAIFGAIRTMEVTVESVIRNLVIPNYPCDVSVSLDEGTLPPVVQSRLQPYLVSFTTLTWCDHDSLKLNDR